MRNTDSFFKDDSVETKKISLTPNLLRDEGGSAEAKEVGLLNNFLEWMLTIYRTKAPC